MKSLFIYPQPQDLFNHVVQVRQPVEILHRRRVVRECDRFVPKLRLHQRVRRKGMETPRYSERCRFVASEKESGDFWNWVEWLKQGRV